MSLYSARFRFPTQNLCSNITTQHTAIKLPRKTTHAQHEGQVVDCRKGTLKQFQAEDSAISYFHRCFLALTINITLILSCSKFSLQRMFSVKNVLTGIVQHYFRASWVVVEVFSDIINHRSTCNFINS